MAVAAHSTCQFNISTVIDPASFGNNGAGVRFDAPRLDRFRRDIDKSFRLAVSKAASPAVCARLRAAAVLRIETASGADEPVIFNDPANRSLVLQWTFAEDNLAAPASSEISAALRRWAKSR